jgi:hypothetical protein
VLYSGLDVLACWPMRHILVTSPLIYKEALQGCCPSRHTHRLAMSLKSSVGIIIVSVRLLVVSAADG